MTDQLSGNEGSIEEGKRVSGIELEGVGNEESRGVGDGGILHLERKEDGWETEVRAGTVLAYCNSKWRGVKGGQV